MKRFELNPKEGGERLDVFIASEIESLSRSQARQLIDKGFVTVNGAPQKAGYRLRGDESIEVIVPPNEGEALEAEDIPLDVLYEDDYILAVNKPSGMVVHPGAGNNKGTLAGAALRHTDGRLSQIGGEGRPGIVHRLDKDTTGVVLIAKDDATHLELKKQFLKKSVYKEYLAVVHGNIKKDTGTINAPIGRDKNNRKKMAVTPGGREAITEFRVLQRFGRFTYISCVIKTGRTHQIRVHMRHMGHPVLGDKKYGPRREPFSISCQMLHAARIGILHPHTKEYVEISAPLPAEFDKTLRLLEKTCGQGE